MAEQKYDTFEDELDAIRLQLYEETQGMTAEEEIAYIYAQSEPILRQFNIKIATLEPVQPKKSALAAST